MHLTEYTMDTGNPRYTIWSTGSQEKYYFYEWLPAFFRRTLTMSPLEAGACLSWIFTGPRGRMELVVTNASLRLRQYYTDSYGLYTKPPAQYTDEVHAHPERLWMEDCVSYEGISGITVVYNRKLEFEVHVNGQLVVTQRCSLELTRHQLSLTGTQTTVRGTMSAEEEMEAFFEVNAEEKYQEIEGFGGITSTLSYQMLSEKGKQQWFDYIKDYNLLIQREYPSRGVGHENKIDWDNIEEAVPHYYGNNFPVGEISDFAYNMKVQELGGTVWFEFWLYPDFAYDNGVLNPQCLIAQIVDYCKTAVKKTGKAPTIVGIQNERCETAEMLQKLVPQLRKALDENGFSDIKLAMCNASFLYEGKEYLQRFQKYEEVWNCIDYATSNVYDYQDHLYTMEDFIPTMREYKEMSGGKPFLSTEIAINRQQFQEDSYHTAFNAGLLFHYNLVELDASAICYCWTLMDVTESSYGFTRTLFTIDTAHGFVPVPSGYILRVFGAFSRHLPAGMQRISMSSDQKDILCSAYQDTQGRQTYLFLNQGRVPVRLHLESLMEKGMEWHTELCDQYHENEKIELSGTEYVIQPGAIFTLYC